MIRTLRRYIICWGNLSLSKIIGGWGPPRTAASFYSPKLYTSLIPNPDLKFPSSKSNCANLNKWHAISVTWSNKGKNASNCWCNGEKLITFTTGNVKGSDHCYIGNFERMPGLNLTGCIGEIIAFYETPDDQKTSHIHEKVGNYRLQLFCTDT